MPDSNSSSGDIDGTDGIMAELWLRYVPLMKRTEGVNYSFYGYMEALNKVPDSEIDRYAFYQSTTRQRSRWPRNLVHLERRRFGRTDITRPAPRVRGLRDPRGHRSDTACTAQYRLRGRVDPSASSVRRHRGGYPQYIQQLPSCQRIQIGDVLLVAPSNEMAQS